MVSATVGTSPDVVVMAPLTIPMTIVQVVDRYRPRVHDAGWHRRQNR